MAGIYERTVLGSLDFPRSNTYPRDIDVNLVNFNSNNVFQRFFEIDLRGPEVEVPVFCRRAVQSILIDNKNFENIEEHKDDIIECYITPLFVSKEETKRTSDSIVRTMLETSTHHKLSKVTTNTGLVYYGGAGVIFNSRMELLMLNVVKYNLTNPFIELLKPIMYISPKVFTGDGPVEKNILKKLIPTVITEGASLNTNTSMVHNKFNYFEENGTRVYTKRVPEIIIADVSDRFIRKPDLPELARFSNEDVNDFLRENIGLMRESMNV
jgi:hypothetical protein